ncbi:MAG TPA: hypothetical protein VMT92_02185 [Steroidobacteraceae bacterium]|nr:hypothetical protein [Steroidobacteraceae bacterium]
MARLWGLVWAVLPLAAGAAPGPTADEIIAHNVEARGGAEKLHALTVLKRTGRLVIPGARIELKVTEWKTAAGEYRQDVTLQGLTAVQAYDGHDAWQVQPFQGRKDPSRMSADEAKGFALAADIAGAFVDYKRKGHRVEYLGLDEVDGTPAHKIRVSLKWGDEATYWIDPDTWMVIRELDRQTLRGAEQWSETDYGEYEQVGGVWVAMTEETGAKGSEPAHRQKFVYESAEANVAPPAGAFTFPESKPRAVAEVRP